MVPEQNALLEALQQRHGRELQERFTAATVAICGLGGLGSHIATALARAGIGRLILIDFDQVDITNLHRQQYTVTQIGRCKTEALAENLLEMAPYLELELHCIRITEENVEELLQRADIICEALDEPEAKAMLTNRVLEKLPGKYLIAASGMAGMGSVNAIQTRRITERFYLCGDGTSDVSEGMGLVAPRVMLCAAHQAHTALRILAKEYEV